MWRYLYRNRLIFMCFCTCTVFFFPCPFFFLNGFLIFILFYSFLILFIFIRFSKKKKKSFLNCHVFNSFFMGLVRFQAKDLVRNTFGLPIPATEYLRFTFLVSLVLIVTFSRFLMNRNPFLNKPYTVTATVTVTATTL